VNSVNLMGRLTRDAELKYTNAGLPVSSGSIAVSKSYMSNGQKVDEVSFFDYVIFGKYAESMNQYLSKGLQVGLSGELKQDRWQDNTGNNRTAVKITVHHVEFGARPNNNGGGNNTQNQGNNYQDGNNQGGGYRNNTQQNNGNNSRGGYNNQNNNNGQRFTPDNSYSSPDFEDDIPF